MRASRRCYLSAILIVASFVVSSAQQQDTVVDLSRFFTRGSGAFVLFNKNAGTYLRYQPRQCAQRFSPASTFKIPNSLIGLETGVIPDQYVVLPWDGVKRSVESWNRNHDLRSAIANSVVWYYQELARRVGVGRMDSLLRVLKYGNMDITGGIDRFWLGSSMRISAEEQVQLLRRLQEDALPFSRRSQEIVKDILILEKSDDYILRAKTGSATFAPDSAVVWFVGYVEKRGNTYFFACNTVTGKASRDQNALFEHRKTTPLKILESMGLH